MTIRFGTSGWRAIIADEFTFFNVRKVTQAIVKYLKEHRLQKKGMLVGYDTRFLSKEFAAASAQAIADNDIKVFLTDRDAPTPVVAYHILEKKTAGAINITASHNPPQYNGIKFSPSYGGPAPPEITKEIERNIKGRLKFPKDKDRPFRKFDPRPSYLRRIRQLVDISAIRKADLKIGVDLLYGTGRGYLDQLLKETGCEVLALHGKLDSFFGGLPPEPAEEQLAELTALVKKRRLHLGLAVDGDADRFGIVDADGTYINANQVVSLLTEHMMLTRSRQKRVARTLATTHMVDALAKRRGLKTVETPVGFKFIGQELAKGGCLIGGEESGGLSIVGHVPEKDGILACLLIAEMVAIRKKPLTNILKELYSQVGPFYTARIDFHLNKEEKQDVAVRLKSFSRKKTVLGERVARYVGLDGHKFIFTDGSWLMFRVSGTEPVVRCYLEAHARKKLRDLQALGHRMISK